VRVPIAILLGIGGLTSPVAAQRMVSLTKPQATFVEPFSTIAGVRELRDGRVLVSDFRDRTVTLVDLDRGSARQVGRRGQGPAEYSQPGLLLALPNGETLVADYGNLRYLVIDRNGSPGRVITSPEGSAQQSSNRPLGTAVRDTRGADAKGRLYFDAPLLTITTGSVDSAPVVRWDREATAFETVAWLPPRVRSEVGSSPTSCRRSAAGTQFWFLRRAKFGCIGEETAMRPFPSTTFSTERDD
jgi:hypothetical protein